MKILVLIAALCLPGLALAAGDDRPWADGVSQSNQDRALELFRQGNDAYARSEYAEAARLYRQALELWDHPAIHGNLAQALIHLEEPVEALAELELAMKWEDKPYDGDVYAHLQISKKLLLGQLARIEVACNVDAEVTLDGKVVLDHPGNISQMVVAGPHQIVARKANHLTFTSQVVALPTRPVVVNVTLIPLERAGSYERRMATWKPWAVLGGGAAIMLLGLGLELSASSNLDAYETEIARECPSGCRPKDLPGPVRDLASRGESQSRWAVGAFAVGGAAVLTGAVLLYLNQPYHVEVDENGNRLGVAPLVGPHLAGAQLTLEY